MLINPIQINMKIKAILIALPFAFLISCNTTKDTKTEVEKTEIETTTTKTERSITNTHWKLTTLEGQKVTREANQEKDIFIMLNSDASTITGFAGCNSLSGAYILEDGNRVRFDKMAVTMKACPDIKFNESEFLKALELTDNYTIYDGVLSLNVGRRAPLAVFEAVDMQ